MVFLKLQRLTEFVKADESLRNRLVRTENQPEPILEFCKIANSVGVDLTPYELIAVGEEYSDNQCKSTNGGNPSPYDSFCDIYETFIDSIKRGCKNSPDRKKQAKTRKKIY